MSLLDKIKTDIKKSGSNRGKLIYLRDGDKKRIRFLEDLNDGHVIVFHDSFDRNINVPCQETFDRECPYCEDEDLRTRENYAWSVWDYDANEVKILMYSVNNYTPVPALVNMYETFGTLCDRDYMLSVTGKQQNKSFGVVPMDKAKFRNTKAKPLSEKALFKLLDKAFPCDESEDGDEDERDYKHSKTKKNKKDVVDKSEEDWDDEDDDKMDYESMSPKELYKLCKDREIECVPKKAAKYYINLLEEYDQAEEDWGDEEEDDDDDWE